jgi:glutamine cyclotransferase
LFESTGNYGQSRLTAWEPDTGQIVRATALPAHLFGEGLALMGDELMQLTWKERQVLVYDKTTLHLKRTLRYDGEAWGATYDGRHLILSNGTSVLRFLDPRSLKEMRRITVRDGDFPVESLNELEYVEGEILANVYGSDNIARIRPETGKVVGWLDLSDLYPAERRTNAEAVLNGIAYDPQRRVLYVTGKYWPTVFVIPAPKPQPVSKPH